MNNRGVTLVELISVLAIMAILMTLATLAWNDMQNKAAVEAEAKMMYADLMGIRLQALYSKRARSVDISGLTFKIYSSEVITAAPLETKNLRYTVVWNTSGPLKFDAQGLMSGSERSVCILPTGDTTVVNTAAVDSIVISAARMNLGRRTGGDCKSANIDQK